MSEQGLAFSKNAIALAFKKDFDLVSSSRSYDMVSFWCGRSYAGWSDSGVREAIARHTQSGCKGCRRGKRRFEARIRRERAGLKVY